MKHTNQLIGGCGLDCETSDAGIATLTNDNALREKTAELWTLLIAYSKSQAISRLSAVSALLTACVRKKMFARFVAIMLICCVILL